MIWPLVLAYVAGLLTPVPFVLFGRAALNWAERKCLEEISW